jgi:hypothetical protein
MMFAGLPFLSPFPWESVRPQEKNGHAARYRSPYATRSKAVFSAERNLSRFREPTVAEQNPQIREESTVYYNLLRKVLVVSIEATAIQSCPN